MNKDKKDKFEEFLQYVKKNLNAKDGLNGICALLHWALEYYSPTQQKVNHLDINFLIEKYYFEPLIKKLRGEIK